MTDLHALGASDAPFARMAALSAFDPNGAPITLTYAERAAQGRAFAAGLRKLGLGRGSVVAALLGNGPAYVAMADGVRLAGCALAPLNPATPPAALADQLAMLEPALVALSAARPGGLDALAPALAASRVGALVVFDLVGPPPETLGGAPVMDAAAFAPTPERVAAYEPARRAPSDLARLQPTGGTSGEPKFAMLTDGAVAAARDLAKTGLVEEIRPGEAVLFAAPLHHVFGALMLELVSAAGARAVLTDAAGLGQTLAAHEIAGLFGPDVLFQGVMALAKAHALELSGIRFAIGGGDKISGETSEAWRAMTGRHIVEGYGMTEAAGFVSVNPMDGVRFSGAVGRPTAPVAVSILDEDGRALPAGEEGEIAVAGPQLMSGYWRRPDESAAAFAANGAYLTGDLGALGADGRLEVRGRKSDVIVVSGFNVHPIEVERVLKRHPAVADAACVGEADARSGARVRAHVRLAEGAPEPSDALAEALRDHARESLLAYKVPKRVVFETEPFAYSAQKKLLRRTFRDDG